MLSPGNYHKLVPRDPVKNAKMRIAVLKRAKGNASFRRALRVMCRRDILFYINLFVWQFNPTKIGLEGGPFVTWDFQDVAASEILRAIEDQVDLIIEKSREMGASWLCLIVQEWLWHFHPMKKFLCMSKSEEAVEADDPDSLFWKLDYIHTHTPDWLMPKSKRRRKRFFGNDDLRSTVTGVASTGDAGVGGRATAMFIDEMTVIKNDFQVLHHTSDTARCRIMNGTHRGTDTAFYSKSKQPDIRKLQMHWTQHPEKRKGLYRYDPEKNVVEVLDKAYHFPVDFEFVMVFAPTGGPFPGIRSPWYDAQCLRKASPQAVAMDLDINPKGSVSQFFDPVMIEHLKRQYCIDPLWVGDVLYDREDGSNPRLSPAPSGRLKLWFRPQDGGKVPGYTFVMGADLSTGVGSTPSCISIARADTGEKVGEYSDAHVPPPNFAVLAVALCKLFVSANGVPAKLAWERQGPGTPFGKKVLELGYRNIFWQTYETKLLDDPSDVPGWYPSPENKRILLEEYRAALINGDFLNRSEEALSECHLFKYGKSGHIEHGEQETGDPNVARVNHADHVIADALTHKMVKAAGIMDRRKKEATEEPKDVRSLAGRRKLWDMRQSNRDEDM